MGFCDGPLRFGVFFTLSAYKHTTLLGTGHTDRFISKTSPADIDDDQADTRTPCEDRR